MPYPAALVITLAIELPLYVGILRRARLMKSGRAALAALAVNAATHPLAWLAVRGADPYWPTFAAVEAAVWLAESLLLILLIPRQPAIPILAALAANGASALAALLV